MIAHIHDKIAVHKLCVYILAKINDYSTQKVGYGATLIWRYLSLDE